MVLRSAVHVARGSARNRNDAPKAKPTADLPLALRAESSVTYDRTLFPLCEALVDVLERMEIDSACATVGRFQEGSPRRLENFTLDDNAYLSPEKMKILNCAVMEADDFLEIYKRLLDQVIIPYLISKLEKEVWQEGELREEEEFFCQFPPTLRIQPGPSTVAGRMHNDIEYGHQIGEVNFWLPLTDFDMTRTALWVESSERQGDFHCMEHPVGSIGVFHGSLCRHFAPANSSAFTRMSLDFRVGVGKYYDHSWVLRATKNDHTRLRIPFRRAPQNYIPRDFKGSSAEVCEEMDESETSSITLPKELHEADEIQTKASTSQSVPAP